MSTAPPVLRAQALSKSYGKRLAVAANLATVPVWEKTAGRFLDRVFDGMASQLVSSLLDGERISPEELERIVALIARARRRKDDRGGGAP